MNGRTSLDNDTWLRLDARQPVFNMIFPPIAINPRLLNFDMTAPLPPKPFLPLAIPFCDPTLPLQNRPRLFGLYSHLLGTATSSTSDPEAPQLPIAASDVKHERQEDEKSQRKNADVAETFPPSYPTLDTNPIIQEALRMLPTQNPLLPSDQGLSGQHNRKIRSPCLVCLHTTSISSHFGIRSCNACAAFFRRSVSQQRKYFCRANDTCHEKIRITNDWNGYRKLCKSCRMKRCLKAGMMPESVEQKSGVQPTKAR